MNLPQVIQAAIDRVGFCIVPVFGGKYPFAYTVGLTETAHHPELLVFGLPPQLAGLFLSDLAGRVLEGHSYRDGDVVVDVANLPMALRTVSDAGALEYAAQAVHRYEHASQPARVLQVVLSDIEGRLPWQEGHSPLMRTVQPHLWATLQ